MRHDSMVVVSIVRERADRLSWRLPIGVRSGLDIQPDGLTGKSPRLVECDEF